MGQELLLGASFRLPHPENPQRDLQCALTDVRDFGRGLLKKSSNLGSNEGIEGTSVKYETSHSKSGVEEIVLVHQELSSCIFRDITVKRYREGERDRGFIEVGYLDNSGFNFEEYHVKVPFEYSEFRFEVTDGSGLSGQEDIEEFRIENMTDEQRACKAAFIRRVLQTVIQDLPLSDRSEELSKIG